MDAWETHYLNYRQLVEQSLMQSKEVIVVSPDNDDLPPNECAVASIVVGNYDDVTPDAAV